MSAATNPSGYDPDAERAQRQLALLDELADIGMVMARALRDEVLGADPGVVDAKAVGQGYAAIAKAVRQCFWLQQKLSAGEVERQAEAAHKRLWAPKPEPARPRHPRRDKLVEVMADLIDRKAGDTQADLDDMESEFCERLEDYGERDFERRPLSAIIAEICMALDVQPDWDLWADQDWAVEEAQTNSPGSPYAERTPAAVDGDIPPPKPLANGRTIPEHPPP